TAAITAAYSRGLVWFRARGAVGVLPKRVRLPDPGRDTCGLGPVTRVPERALRQHGRRVQSGGLAQQAAAVNNPGPPDPLGEQHDKSLQLRERHIEPGGAPFVVYAHELIVTRLRVLHIVVQLIGDTDAADKVVRAPQ